MRKLLMVLDITNEYADFVPVEDATGEVLYGEADTTPFTLIDLNGTDISLALIPLGEGGFKILVHQYRQEQYSSGKPFEQFIAGLEALNNEDIQT